MDWRSIIGRSTGATLSLAAAGALVSGCTSNHLAAPGPVLAEISPELNQQIFSVVAEKEYALRPTDKLSVSVFREPELSLGEVSIAADGRISVPLLGSIDTTGLTASELERLLEEEFGARYLRDPQVSVNVIDYVSHLVTVEGAVETPGIYQFKPGTRLSGGIALAEGLSRVAQQKEIAVFRETNGIMQVAKFDLAAMRQGSMVDPYIQPGDRIVVGTDNLTQAWQDILRAIPAFGLFTQI